MRIYKFLTGLVSGETDELEEFYHKPDVDAALAEKDFENNSLRKGINEIKEANENIRLREVKLESELTQLKEKLRVAEACIGFYAKGGNFNTDVWKHETLGYFTGAHAIRTLKKLEGL